jgi:putative phosphoesterase
VIADTHGYLDPQVLTIFAGVDLIIHAGDIVDPATLTALKEVAPVTAVAGNIDPADLAASLLREATGEVGGVSFVVSHKRKRLMKRLAAGKIAFGAAGATPDLVVFGHEHVPSAVWVDGTLFLNPGTASSPEEEDDGPTVAIVEAEPTGLAVRFVPLRRRSEAEVAAAVDQSEKPEKAAGKPEKGAEKPAK